MKSALRRVFWCATAAATMSAFAVTTFGQSGGDVQVVDFVRNPNQPISVKIGINPASNRAAMRAAADASTIPLWSYSVVASDGNTYQGVMVGTDAFNPSDITTSVPTPIIPVIVQLGPFTYDPTAPDPCLSGGTVSDLVSNSPIFGSTDYVMNGVDVGNTQYTDAFQRANFWSLVGGNEYHTLVQPTVMPAQTYNTGGFVTNPVFCGGTTAEGAIEINAFNNWVVTVALPAAGVDPTQFPILLLQNVVMYDTVIDNCCIGGFHGTLSNFQTYSPSGVDTTGFFGGSDTGISDTAILSHEVAEWMDDPLGNNPTPAWGHIGQVQGCQANLEVGDPLTGTLFPTVTMSGFPYHMQELAFFSWFYGDNPSLGAGGVYSNNQTFTVPASPCP